MVQTSEHQLLFTQEISSLVSQVIRIWRREHI